MLHSSPTSPSQCTDIVWAIDPSAPPSASSARGLCCPELLQTALRAGAGAAPGLLGSQCLVSLQEDKVYVQHRIRENGRLLWELLSTGNAHIYLAG